MKDILRICPHHGLLNWMDIDKFYNGLNANTRNMVDNAARGSFMRKEIPEAFALLDELAITNFEFFMDRIPPRRPKGMHEIDTEQAKTAEEEVVEEPKVEVVVPSYKPPIPFPQRLKINIEVKNFLKFLEVFKKLLINIPFTEVLDQMPSFAKFLKEILSNKRRLDDQETVMLTKECSAIIQNKLPSKLKDPRSFTIPCNIGNVEFIKALCDLGTSINLMPLYVFRKLGLGEVKPTIVSLQLADRSVTYPRGVIEDEDREIPMILGRPFLTTGKALIDVHQEKLTLRVGQEEVAFNVLQSSKYPNTIDVYFRIDTVDECNIAVVNDLNSMHEISESTPTPKLKLKPLSSHLRYAFLGESSTHSVIISNHLGVEEEIKMLKVLNMHKKALGWSIDDIKSITPSLCMHKILIEDDCRPFIEHQRRLNPNMKEIVRAKVIKLLDASIIYPISNSNWMLERLSGYPYCCFLDGYLGYFQILIALENQEKTTFTCPLCT
ncbi:hypothetical protein MANES_08G082266v8, partial [Manihot esculenta]